jgi:hypothetical protein
MLSQLIFFYLKVVELKVKASPVSEVEKPKAFIHWVADPVEVEVSFAILHSRDWSTVPP